ncbi:hypothetical protein Tco_0707813 [Tanacetum coccineum]
MKEILLSDDMISDRNEWRARIRLGGWFLVLIVSDSSGAFMWQGPFFLYHVLYSCSGLPLVCPVFSCLLLSFVEELLAGIGFSVSQDLLICYGYGSFSLPEVERGPSGVFILPGRPPLIEPNGFCFWKARFETFVKSKDIDLWQVIQNDDFYFKDEDKETKLMKVTPYELLKDNGKKPLGKINEAKVTREQTSDDRDSQGGSDEDINEEDVEAFNLLARNFCKVNRFGCKN